MPENQYQKDIKELDKTLSDLQTITDNSLSFFSDSTQDYKVINARSKNIKTVLEQKRYDVMANERIAMQMIKTTNAK